MSTSSDSAEEIVRLSLEGFEVVARLTGNMAKEMAVLLYAMSKDTKKKTKGQTRINNMLKSNSNLRIFTIKKDEYQDFKKQAKRYGVLYSALYKKSEKNKDGVIDILVREEDAVRVNRIIERFNLTTVDTTKIESKIEKIDIEKEQKKEEKVEVQKTIQEKNTSDDLLNKLLKKEPVNEENDTPSNIQNTEKETQLENLLKTREKNEKIKEEKPSMREELNKIKQEKAEKEKIKSKEEIKETSKKETMKLNTNNQKRERRKKKGANSMSTINDILKSAINNVQKEQKDFNVEEWAKNKQHDREFAYQTQDEMAKKITEYGEIYKTYLDVQSRFPNYSVGNALLVTAQNPKATQLKDAESWKKDKINFIGKPNPIIILEPGNIYTREDGTEAQGYDPKNVYDISDMRVKRQLNTVPYTHESILKAVLSMSPVQVEIVQNTSNSSKLVNFNADTRTIEVSQNAEVKETIQGLIREVASIHLLSFADTELNNFKNESVAYMISKRYGMPTNNFNFDKIPQELKEMTAQEVKAELAKGAECLQILTEGMDREIGMNSKTKTNREYER